MGRGGLLQEGRPGQRPGVAIPGQMCMSLQAMKSAHELVVVGLARMVQEQPAAWLAGMDQHKYALAKICTKYA